MYSKRKESLRVYSSPLPTFPDHTRLEVSLNLNETNAISPPRPFLGERLKRGEGSKHKDVGKDEGLSRRILTRVR